MTYLNARPTTRCSDNKPSTFFFSIDAVLGLSSKPHLSSFNHQPCLALAWIPMQLVVIHGSLATCLQTAWSVYTHKIHSAMYGSKLY